MDHFVSTNGMARGSSMENGYGYSSPQQRNGKPNLTGNASLRLALQQRDIFISWIRGEFAAANAIIDALCNHLKEVGEAGEYDAALACIQERRMLWLPLLQMQHYYSVADVALSLRRVASSKASKRSSVSPRAVSRFSDSDNPSNNESPRGRIADDENESGQPEENSYSEVNKAKNEERHTQSMLKTNENFEANELIDGRLINIAEGLKLHENVLDSSEISRLTELTQELQFAGKQGNLFGQTFIASKRPMKGNGRETLQFGTPVISKRKKAKVQFNDKTKDVVEPIPQVFEEIVDRLVDRNLISDGRPNCCLINFFHEGEYSQPHLNPWNFGRPFYTLALSKCTMVLGQAIATDHPGSYHGPFELLLSAGSLLSMQGNSVDIARHAISSSPEERILVTFMRVASKNPLNVLPPISNRSQAQQIPLSTEIRSSDHQNFAIGNAYQRSSSRVGTVAGFNCNAATSCCRLPLLQNATVPTLQTKFLGMMKGQAETSVGVAMMVPGWSLIPRSPRMPNPGTGVFLPPGNILSDQRWPVSLSSQKHGIIFVSHMLPRIDNKSQIASPNAHKFSASVTAVGEASSVSLNQKPATAIDVTDTGKAVTSGDATPATALEVAAFDKAVTSGDATFEDE